MAGLYIHIPYCHSKCAYCDFFSTPRRSDIDAYIDSLKHEFNIRKGEIAEPFTTIYIGGGTPSLLTPKQLDKIFSFLPTDGIQEFTIEVNPEDITREMADFIAQSPANRVSMGVQSMDNDELKRIGRRHSASDAIRAVELLHKAGIDNLSLDLIYGLPGQTPESWLHTLSRTLSMAPTHLSAYSLMYEEGTRMWAMLQAGKIAEVSQEVSEYMYLKLCEIMASHGFEHYEISNFAQPGRHSHHNSSYWTLTPYLGLGVSAHSYDGTVRRSNPPALKSYVGLTQPIYITETLSFNERVDEYLLIRLRTRTGISIPDYTARFGNEAAARLLHVAAPIIDSGRLTYRADHLYIPESHWLLTDSIIIDLMP